MTITYRDFEPQDAPTVKRIIDENFSIHKFAPDPVALRGALDLHLSATLGSNSWAQVAVDDGEVVGLLIGNRHGAPALPHAKRNRLRAAAIVVKLALTRLPWCFGLLQYARLFVVYALLNRRHGAPLTDEIALFAVDESAQGKGVGSGLYTNFLDHLARHGRRTFFLYTDSMCSWPFYEHRGMTRVDTQSIRFRVKGVPERVEVYLYTGDVPAHSARRPAEQAPDAAA